MPRNRSIVVNSWLALNLIVIGIAFSTARADNQEIIWIDVRTPAEFASGHVENAVNIEFQLIGEKIANLTTDKNAHIRLYCKSGRRSSVAKQSLQKMGYRNSTNEGGIARALMSYRKQQLQGSAPE